MAKYGEGAGYTKIIKLVQINLSTYCSFEIMYIRNLTENATCNWYNCNHYEDMRKNSGKNVGKVTRKAYLVKKGRNLNPCAVVIAD